VLWRSLAGITTGQRWRAGNLLDDCVPDSLFDLPNVRRLNLARNRLEAVPLLCMFVNLEYAHDPIAPELSMDGIAIRRIVPGTCHRYVNLSGNSIPNGEAQREKFLELMPMCTFEI
jgi:hypothetical protein